MVNYKLIKYAEHYNASEKDVQKCFNEAQQRVYAKAIQEGKIPFFYPEKTLDKLCLKITKQKLENRKN